MREVRIPSLARGQAFGKVAMQCWAPWGLLQERCRAWWGWLKGRVVVRSRWPGSPCQLQHTEQPAWPDEAGRQPGGRLAGVSRATGSRMLVYGSASWDQGPGWGLERTRWALGAGAKESHPQRQKHQGASEPRDEKQQLRLVWHCV